MSGDTGCVHRENLYLLPTITMFSLWLQRDFNISPNTSFQTGTFKIVLVNQRTEDIIHPLVATVENSSQQTAANFSP